MGDATLSNIRHGKAEGISRRTNIISVNPRRINLKEKDENSEDMLGFGDEKVVSSDLMRIKLVFLARHLIAIDSQGR